MGEETEQETELEPMEEFIIGDVQVEKKPDQLPEFPEEKKDEKEIDAITEIEKNLNYVWDNSHNLFRFSIGGKGIGEFLMDFEKYGESRDYYKAYIETKKFLFSYQMALRDDEKYKLIMKEIFNTLKAMQRKN